MLRRSDLLYCYADAARSRQEMTASVRTRRVCRRVLGRLCVRVVTRNIKLAMKKKTEECIVTTDIYKDRSVNYIMNPRRTLFNLFLRP